MKWKFVSCLVVLACLILQAAPVMAQGGGTEVTGTVPLVNSDVSASNITETSATIAWNTNGNATSQVFYDTASHDNVADYAHQTSESLSLVLTHSVSLTGLAAGTIYHYRVKSAIPATVFIDISADYIFATLAPPGGGGGGGGFGSQLVGIGLSGTSPFMDGNGRAVTAGQVGTPDGSLSLSIPIGTYVWNAAGAAQPFLSATPIAEPPQAPPQNSLVLAYELGPTGVTFNPPISLTFNYSDGQVPAGANEADLYIAWWDGAKWVKIEGTVNPAANTVTVQVSHFTTFALLAQQQPSPTTTPPPTTPPPTTMPPPTTTSPAPDRNATNWPLIGFFLIAAIALGIGLYWRARESDRQD